MAMANRKLQEAVEEEMCVSVDEQMTCYKGKHAPSGLSQYLPSKPTSHGFKSFARAGISGFAYEIRYYTGAQTNQWYVSSVPNFDSLLKTTKTVLRLTEHCKPGSFIYFDNLFASKQLFEELSKRGLHYVCTLRPNRFKEVPFTPKPQFEKLQMGTYESFFNEEAGYCVVA